MDPHWEMALESQMVAQHLPHPASRSVVFYCHKVRRLHTVGVSVIGALMVMRAQYGAVPLLLLLPLLPLSKLVVKVLNVIILLVVLLLPCSVLPSV